MGFWYLFVKNFSFFVILKTVLYVADIGSDAYNTYVFYTDCHYHLFATSLALLFLPNLMMAMAEGIRFKLVLAACGCGIEVVRSPASQYKLLH